MLYTTHSTGDFLLRFDAGSYNDRLRWSNARNLKVSAVVVAIVIAITFAYLTRSFFIEFDVVHTLVSVFGINLPI